MPVWAEWGIMAGRAVLVWILPLALIPVLVWVERKASAFMQDRTGPNRASILGIRAAGLIHPIADVVKLVFKEDIVPSESRKFYYFLGPFLAMTFSLMTFAVIPFADVLRVGGHEIHMQALRINPGILWIFALGSFGVYGIIFAGWGAGSKYPLLGGIRGAAQMISYELTLGTAALGIIMVFGTLDLNRIVQGQGHLLFGFLPMWGVVVQPLGAILFILSALAETNRTPFDLPEAESEIVGFHTEYSSMKFALFFMAEYVHMTVASALIVTLFFGGWQIPWLPSMVLAENSTTVAVLGLAALAAVSLLLIPVCLRWSVGLKKLYTDARRNEATFWMVILLLQAVGAAIGAVWFWTHPLTGDAASVAATVMQFATFMIKVVLCGFVFVWIRWTLPRFRYDQLMGLGWKGMLPLAILNIIVTGLVILLV